MGMWLNGTVVYAVDFQLKDCGFDPGLVRFHTSFFSFSTYSWLPTATCACLSMHGRQKKEKKNSRLPKTATESCVLQNQQWKSIQFCNLVGGAIQFCNLIGGVIQFCNLIGGVIQFCNLIGGVIQFCNLIGGAIQVRALC